jgi:hypothetical protein
MIADIIKQIKEIGNREDVKSSFNEILEPCINYANKKIEAIVMFFQIIAVLIICQILATLFLIINEIRRNSA